MLVPDLGNQAVSQDETLAQGGVVHCVHAELQGEVVRAEGLHQGSVLPLDLDGRDGGAASVVVANIDNAVVDALLRAELPMLAVAQDNVFVVADGQAAQRGQEGRDELTLRDGNGQHSRVMPFLVGHPPLFRAGEVSPRYK